MFGLLNLNKPEGLTSRDAVNRVQRVLRRLEGKTRKRDVSKVGHAGTLDPIATGVLVVCVGPATRLIEHVQRMPKRYRGTFLLGRRSPSDDIELEAEPLPGAPVPTLEQITAALPAFVGQIQQAPPAYSAIKIQGRKAYDLARRGERVEIKPRPVTIHALEVASYDYPELVLDIRCGSGTYIRSLGRDLAESLGTGAVMSRLVRTAIGRFTIEEGVDPNRLDEATLPPALLPAALAVDALPRVDLTGAQAEELRHGRPATVAADLPTGQIALFAPTGELFGLGRANRGALWPVRVLEAQTH